jgi:hypothetical protein
MEFNANKEEFQVQMSWQNLIFCYSNKNKEEVAKTSIKKKFKALQRNYNWGHFFSTFSFHKQTEIWMSW